MEFHRTWCGDCKEISIHVVLDSGLVCLHHDKEADKKAVETGLCREMTHVVELRDGSFSLDISVFSKCIGVKGRHEDSMTYMDGLTLDEIEQITFELKTFLLDRTMKKLGGLNG